MGKVEIKFFAGLKNDIGKEKVMLELNSSSSKVENIIDLLISKYGKKAEKALLTQDKKSYKFLVFINKQRMSNPKDAKIKDGDVIYFMPPLSGG